MTNTFQVGKTYECRSFCDYECVFQFHIVKRTAKTLTLEYNGRQFKRGVYTWEGNERCRPLGSYSMSPIICAEKGA